MSRGKLVIFIAVVGGVGIVALNLAVVAMIRIAGGPHVYEPEPFATVAEASRDCGIPLPAEARNVRVASYNQWIAHETYLRFEAPVPVCLRHATVLVPGQRLAPVAADQLVRDAWAPPPDIFRDVSWFDLTAARNVVGTVGGWQNPEVWVDQTRGVLYYRRTD